MPLGDGKGPPDGSGPMTGRKRLAQVCPGVERPSNSKSSLLALVIGVAALLVLAVISFWRGKKTT